MNTLADKRSRITNFNQAVDTYNTWASNSNRHAIVTEEIISNRIDTERLIYVNK
jgi:hypothetical protein